VNLESLNYKIPPVSHYNSRIPGELEKIIGRAMHSDRSRRYGNAVKLRNDLVRVKCRVPAIPVNQAALPAAPAGPFPRPTCRLDDRPRRTTLLHAPVIVTRLLLDYPLAHNTLTPIVLGRKRPVSPAWAGVLSAVSIVFFLFVYSFFTGHTARYAQNAHTIAIIDVLNAFPSGHDSLPHPEEADPDIPDLPGADEAPGGAPPPGTDPDEKEEAEESPVPADRAGTGVEDSSFTVLLQTSETPKVPAPTPPPVTLPPALGTPLCGNESENSITFHNADGSMRKVSIPIASPGSREIQAMTYRSHIYHNPTPGRYSMNLPVSSFRPSTYSRSSSSSSYYTRHGDAIFVPAGSPRSGVTWETTGSRPGGYGFVPASTP
jgi:hypothetical protein